MVEKDLSSKLELGLCYVRGVAIWTTGLYYHFMLLSRSLELEMDIQTWGIFPSPRYNNLNQIH